MGRAGKEIRIGGKTAFVRDAGEGPAVLLIHGIGATSHVFASLIERHQDRFRFLAPDLPCSGFSQAYAHLRAEALAQAMIELLDRLEIDRAVVLGHSYGGMVVIELAHRYRDRLDGLIVSSAPALGLPVQLKQIVAHPMAEWAVRVATRLPSFPFLVRKYLGFCFGNPKQLTDTIVDGYVAGMKGDKFYGAVLEALRCISEYRIPVERLELGALPRQVVWGDRDRLVSVIQGEQVAKAHEAELRILPGAGHCLPEERPDELAEAIAALESKKTRSGARRGTKQE